MRRGGAGRWRGVCRRQSWRGVDAGVGARMACGRGPGWLVIFRDLKTTIELRPVFHRLEHRIRAHVLIAWLAPAADQGRRAPHRTDLAADRARTPAAAPRHAHGTRRPDRANHRADRQPTRHLHRHPAAAANHRPHTSLSSPPTRPPGRGHTRTSCTKSQTRNNHARKQRNRMPINCGTPDAAYLEKLLSALHDG